MSCYLCQSNNIVQRNGSVRGAPQASILECKDCGFVFLGNIETIDYSQGGMGSPEPETWLEESEKDDNRRFNGLRERIIDTKVLDVGCGAGGFLIRASKIAQVMGVEPDCRVAGYFRSLGLDVRNSIKEVDGVFDVITLFHVLEHFNDPREILKQLGTLLTPGGMIIAEVPNADDALLSLYGSTAFSNFVYWSCHRHLFNAKTITNLAHQAGFKVERIEHIQRYPLSNHLHWLAKGEKDGHWKWRFLDSHELSLAYENTLRRIGKTDTLTAYLQ